MPRIRVTEEPRITGSIRSLPDPVCPRCLGIVPGTPGGDPNDPHPGPFADELCLPCGRAVQTEQANAAFGSFPPCACGKGSGCFGENVCIECFRSAQKSQTETPTKQYTLAPHAVAIRPMQVWPRPHCDGPIDGPLRMAVGACDFDGLGREKFWDQTAEERAVALSVMVSDAGAQLDRLHSSAWKVANENRIFARGWLNELERTRSR
jgi:hypothetical protein